MEKEKSVTINKPLRSASEIAMEKTGVEIKKETGGLKTAVEIAMNKKEGETNWNVDKAEQKDVPDQNDKSKDVKNEDIKDDIEKTEREQNVDTAIQDILDAEDKCEKKKKSKKKFDGLISKFKMVFPCSIKLRKLKL